MSAWATGSGRGERRQHGAYWGSWNLTQRRGRSPRGAWEAGQEDPVAGSALSLVETLGTAERRYDVIPERSHVPPQHRNSWIVRVPVRDLAYEPEQALGIGEMVVSPPLGAYIESAGVQLDIEPGLSVIVRSPSSRLPSYQEGEPAELKAQYFLGVVLVHQVGYVLQ